MSDKNIENELVQVIEALADVCETEKEQKYNTLFADALKDVTFDSISKWELFKYDFSAPLEVHIKKWYLEKYPKLSRSALSSIVFYYMHYDFLDNNVEKLVDMERGCCADKSRNVLKNYLNYLLSGEITEYHKRNDKEHKYWEPDFGTAQEWIDFVASLEYLYYGHTEKYLNAISSLNKTKLEVKKEIVADEKIANGFVPEYVKILERIKPKLDKEAYETMSKKYYYGLVIYRILDEIKAGTVSDELVIDVITKEYEKRK